MIQVVLVDNNDNPIGLADKVAAHLGDGQLHRAFTILLFNNQGETLIAKRSAKKMLWPLFWDGACASHPMDGESQVEAGKRRLVEELGVNCNLEEVDKFQYHEKYYDIGSENEVCAILIGHYDGEVKPNPEEVADYSWINISNLKDNIAKNPENYAIWFRVALDRLIEQDKIKI